MSADQEKRPAVVLRHMDPATMREIEALAGAEGVQRSEIVARLWALRRECAEQPANSRLGRAVRAANLGPVNL